MGKPARTLQYFPLPDLNLNSIGKKPKKKKQASSTAKYHCLNEWFDSEGLNLIQRHGTTKKPVSKKQNTPALQKTKILS